MNDYKNAVQHYANTKEDYMLHNEGERHALVIFENLFRTSKSHVRIVAKDLANKEVVNTPEYINAMRVFLNNPSSQLDILLSGINPSVKNIPDDINFFKFLLSTNAYKEGRVRVKQSRDKTFKLNRETAHFCTSDGHAYRMEYDIINRKAWCNFGNETTTKELEKVFDQVFNDVPESINLNELVN